MQKASSKSAPLPQAARLGAAARPVSWRRSPGLVAYPEAIATMEARVRAIHEGTAGELLWLVEHPPLYTAGTSAAPEELLGAGGLPVYATGRGGRFTYHGPGQRVGYLMVDLGGRGRDLKRYVHDLEEWLILALARLGVAGERRADRIGIWVRTGAGEAKIAALGVRVRRWVTYHGIALNVAPDLAHFQGIVPCGIRGYGVTSLAALGVGAGMAEADAALLAAFPDVFGPLAPEQPA